MSHSKGASIVVLEKKLFADTWAGIATRRVKIGQIINLRGYSVNNVGGGNLIGVDSTGLTADDGFISVTGAAGVYAMRINPKKTPYEFGYLDGAADLSIAANKCAAVHGEIYLEGGKTYALQKQINTRKLIATGNGVATLSLTSPTANNRWGSPTSTTVNTAAVYCAGGVGAPLVGVDVQNVNVACNNMLISTGAAGVKGFLFFRAENFNQKNCRVTQCASYAFWDTDTSGSGTTYCSGTRDDCWAVDSQVSFEQVNVRNVVLNNCHGYISSATLPFTPEAMYHFYGGADMLITYNNCSGIADGVCIALILGLLSVKNVAINDCEFLNRYNNGVTNQSCMILDASGSSDFNNINCKNTIFKADYSPSIFMTFGLLGSVDNSFNFTDCEIDGYGVGIQLNGNGGKYSFNNCEIRGRASSTTDAYGIYANGAPTSVQVTAGTVKTSTIGSGQTIPTNLSNSIFTNTILIPSVNQLPRARQRTVGRAVITGDGSTYATLQTFFPGAVIGWTSASVGTQKVSAVMTVDYGHSGAATFPAAVAMCYPYVHNMPSNNQVRFVMPQALQGKICTYEITEWE